VVPAHADAVPIAGLGQLGHDVALEGGGHDVVVGVLRVEEAEAVVMLARDHDVLHARVTGGPGPLVGVEANRVEPLQELIVGVDRDLRRVPDPLAVVLLLAPLARGDGVEPPVDEQAEPRLAPPVHSLIGLVVEVVQGILRGARRRRSEQEGQGRGDQRG
jgi:hypothetical protein